MFVACEQLAPVLKPCLTDDGGGSRYRTGVISADHPPGPRAGLSMMLAFPLGRLSVRPA